MMHDLAEYTGRVTNLKWHPERDAYIWRIFCGCETITLTRDMAVEFFNETKPVELERYKYARFSPDTGIEEMVYIWMGRCPKCGTIFQTWYPEVFTGVFL